MKSALLAGLAATLVIATPAWASGLFGFNWSGYTVAVTNDVHTSSTDGNGNTKKVDSTSTVVYPKGTTPPANLSQQTYSNNTSPGSSNNTQTVTQKQTIIIVGHH